MFALFGSLILSSGHLEWLSGRRDPKDLSHSFKMTAGLSDFIEFINSREKKGESRNKKSAGYRFGRVYRFSFDENVPGQQYWGCRPG